MRKVMVFGTFDGVHEGHKQFFKEARMCGDHVIAVVAQDVIVEQLKGRRPVRDMARRFAELNKLDGVDEVVIGDSESGAYDVVVKYRPDVIALGYDQTALKGDFEEHYATFSWKPKIVILGAYEPDKYHSSILRT